MFNGFIICLIEQLCLYVYFSCTSLPWNLELKVYGAGLLSSVAELRHAIETNDKIKRFDPEVTCHQECIITSYQNAYYYSETFEEAKEKMR
jgi:phenylalanine-4-hydroxylase